MTVAPFWTQKSLNFCQINGPQLNFSYSVYWKYLSNFDNIKRRLVCLFNGCGCCFQVVSLPARIDPLQTSAVVSLHGRLYVRVPFEKGSGWSRLLLGPTLTILLREILKEMNPLGSNLDAGESRPFLNQCKLS